MAVKIDSLIDKDGDIILPRTRTKAIYDDDNNRLDDTLKELQDTLTGFKTYTSVEQLGLTYPCTTVSILKAMPNKSMFTVNVESMSSSITDAPVSWGVLKIIKITSSRRELDFIRSMGSVCDRYTGGYDSSEDKVTWNCVRQVGHVIPISDGGTGATTASAAIANLHGVESTTADITYYVSPSGSDSNSGTSSSAPFKTLAYALSKLPKYIAHNITFNLAAGTYTEDTVVISNFTGPGEIRIDGDIDNALNYYFENGISVSNIDCNLVINGISFGVSSANYGLLFSVCSGHIFVYRCQAYESSTTSGSAGFYVSHCSDVYFSECEATHLYYGFTSDNNSQTTCRICSCTNCSYPWSSTSGSLLFLMACSSSEYTAETILAYAGVIVTGNGVYLGA